VNYVTVNVEKKMWIMSLWMWKRVDKNIHIKKVNFRYYFEMIKNWSKFNQWSYDFLIVACACVGRNCSVNIDECESNPCEHNGTCIDQVNGYSCMCIAGITGANCETNVDDCQSSPCVNGRCIDWINRYCCFAFSVYSARFCMVNMNSCDDVMI